MLRQALFTRLVRQTLCQWCAADLEMRRQSEISKKTTQNVRDDGGKAELVKKSTQFPLSFMQYKVNGNWYSLLIGVFSFHFILLCARDMYDALLLQDDADLIDLPPESLWACLLSAAGLPASMCLRSEAGVTTTEAVGQAADGPLTQQETIKALDPNTSGGGGLIPAQSNVESASTNDSGILKTATVQDSVAGSSTAQVLSGLVVQPISWYQALVVIQLAYKARFRHVSMAGQAVQLIV